MPDKHHTLVNQGWEDMKSILDVEMPVKKKNRRFLWIPLTAGLVIALLWMSYIGYRSFNTVPAIEQSTDQKYSHNAGPSFADSDDDNANDPLINDKSSTGSSITSIEYNSASTKSSINSSNEIIAGDESKLAFSQTENTIIPSSQSINDSNKTTELSGGGITTKATDANASNILKFTPGNDEESISTNPTVYAGGLFALASINIQPLKARWSVRNPSLTLTDIRTDPSRSPVQAIVALEAGSFPEAHGYTIGGQLGLSQSIHPKWSFMSELGMHRAFSMQGSILDLTNLPQENNDLMDMDLSSGSAPMDDDFFIPLLPQFNTIEDLQIIEWSNSIVYHLADSWSTFGGIIIGYQYGSYIDNLSNTSSRVSLPVSNDFSQWNLGLSAGLSYSPLSRLSLQLRYRHQFDDYIPALDYSGVNERVSFGIHWRIR